MMDNMSKKQGTAVIEARHIEKAFGDVIAASDVTFTVQAGQVLGLLGPNGAGKTTVVKMLTTLLPLDQGAAFVGGFDVATQPDAVRKLIGLAGQAAAVDEKLTARENLELFGRLYKMPKAKRRQRTSELLSRFDMDDFADRPVSTLSGGQRRRLDVVAALVADPAALFLDEPTTGLDPRSRAEIWETIRDLADSGTAIVLTTQYLEEADRLADHVIVIDHGVEVAAGSPDELKTRLGRDVLEVHVATESAVDAALTLLEGANGAVTTPAKQRIDIALDRGAPQALELLRLLDHEGIEIDDFQLRRPTLDDVFLALTGSAASDSIDNNTGGQSK